MPRGGKQVVAMNDRTAESTLSCMKLRNHGISKSGLRGNRVNGAITCEVAGQTVEGDLVSASSLGTESNVVEHPSNSRMHTAIKAGDISHVRSLLRKGEKICWSGDTNCITWSGKHGHLELMRELIKLEPRGVNATSNEGHILSYCEEAPEIFIWILKQIKDDKVVPTNIVCDFIQEIKQEQYKTRVIDHLKSIQFKINPDNLLKYFNNDKEIVKMFLNNQIVDKTSKLDINSLLNYCNKPKDIPMIKLYLKSSLIDLQTKIKIPTLHTYLYKSEDIPLMNFYVKNGLVDLNPTQELCIFEDPNNIPILKFYTENDLIDIANLHMIDKLAESFENCYPLNAKAIIKIFNDLKLPLEDSKGKSLIHFKKNASINLHLLQLEAKINPEYESEFLCKLVDEKYYSEEICESLDIVSKRGIVISGGDKSLFELVKDVQVTKKLLDLNCEDTVPPNIMVKLHLETMFQLFDLPIKSVKTLVNDLIAKGANIIAKDDYGCSIYCHALAFSKTNTPKSIQICKFIISYPEFQTEDFNFTCTSRVMYDHLPAYKLLPMLFDNINFKKLMFSNENVTLLLRKFEPYNIGKKAAFLQYLYQDLERKNFYREAKHRSPAPPEPWNNLIQFVATEWCEDDEEFGLSTLSVVLCHYNFESYYYNQDLKLLTSRVNIESSNLMYKDETLRHLQYKLQIPDVFLIASIKGDVGFIERYREHLACSPICLVIFAENVCEGEENLKEEEEEKVPLRTYQTWKKNRLTIHKLERLLTFSDRVPHGTLVFTSLRNKLLEVDQEEKLIKYFDNQHKQPLTLLELCRDIVRISLAKTAARDNAHSLPELYDSLVPPELKYQILKKKLNELVVKQQGML